MSTLELTQEQARLLSRAIGDRLDNLGAAGLLAEFHELYQLDCIVTDILMDSDDWEAEQEAESAQWRLEEEADRMVLVL